MLRSKKTPEEKAMRERLSDLRIHFNNMDKGKRILLNDGRIGYFRGYSGTAITGDTISFEHNGLTEDVPLHEYASVLIKNEKVQCPACGSDIIMDGYLRGSEDIRVSFRENITDNLLKSPTFNSRSIKCHACYACGYVMLFVGLRKQPRN